MIKYFNTVSNERGDVLANYRVQVVDSLGASVDIFADAGGTRFTDSGGNIVNYTEAQANGRVAFYWTPADGQVLQTLDASGNLVDAEADFANAFVLANLPGNIGQSAVTNLVPDLAAKTAVADLASTAAGKGAALVGTADGVTVQQKLDTQDTSLAANTKRTRRLSRQLAPKAFALAETPKAGVAIQRLRTDRLEFAAYVFLNAAGTKLHRHLITNRLNPNAGGASNLYMSTLAVLYASSILAKPAENYTTGAYATATTSTQATTAATDTGSWTAPAAVSGVADISRQTTPGSGATRTYSYTLAAGENKRIDLRGANIPGNGGKAKVTIRRDGTEISASEYLLPLVGSERVASYVDRHNWGNTLTHIPACVVSNPTGSPQTITILLEESVQNNGTNNRIYDGGLLIYNAVAYNATGLHAIAKENATLGGVASLELPHPGSQVVVSFTNTTRVSVDYVKTNSGGKVSFAVYDSGGTEIATYVNNEVDTYSATTSTGRVTVAEGLTKGTYHLVATVQNTKNASSSNYRFYYVQSIGQDESTPGTLGVDLIDNLDVADQPGDFLAMSENCFIGSNNVEAAFELQPSGYTYTSTTKFVTGTHRNDTDPTNIAVSIDGADATASYNALPQFGWLYADEVARISFDSNVDTAIGDGGTGTPGTVLGTMSYTYEFDRYGYHPDTTFTQTAAGKMRTNYPLMLQCPGSNSNSPSILNRGAGGGFELLGFDRGENYNLNDYASSAYIEGVPSDTMVFANSEYAVIATLNNYPELIETFDGVGQDETERFMFARSTSYNKGYLQLNGNDSTSEGFEVPSGFVWRTRKTYRVVVGDYRRVLGVAA